MKRYILLIPILMFVFSCENFEFQKLPSIEDGTYYGTFIRSSPNAKYAYSAITLVLTNNQFQGISSMPKYPAICSGSFEKEKNQIEFVNECAFTADFDWTLILSGKFEVSFVNNELILTRTLGDVTDTYQLQKKTDQIAEK